MNQHFCADMRYNFVQFPFFLRYMKYLYPYECERKGFSSPGELQAAIDSNRREGRRPSYSSSLFRFSPSPSTAPHILSPPKMHLSALAAGTSGALNGLQASPGVPLKKGRKSARTMMAATNRHTHTHMFMGPAKIITKVLKRCRCLYCTLRGSWNSHA